MLRPRFVVSLALAGLIAGGVLYARQSKSAPAKAPAKAAAAKAAAEPAGPVIVIETAKGNIEIETSPAEGPKSVAHILSLVRQNFYRGQRIWWSTPALVQFGDPLTRDMTKKDMWGTGGSGKIVDVDESGLAKHKFVRGTVGLGYRQGYNAKTADSYLIIIKGSNSAMDSKYAVIGRVTDGLAAVDKLAVDDRIVNMYVKGEKK